jgi:hypothetical protein
MVGACGTALVMGLLAAGCTPDPGPDPGTSPTPSVSSAAPSPIPTENAQERQQRLDFEAAEKAYLTAAKETDRLAVRGGAAKATPTLTENTVGNYLDFQMEGLRTLKDEDWRADRAGIVAVTARGGWSEKELNFTACEDSSQVKLLNNQDKEVQKDRPRRFVQDLTATRADGRWKISDVESTVVKAFDNPPGCAS